MNARLRIAIAHIRTIQEREHDRAVFSHPMFSREHWEHNGGMDWPREPDDGSFVRFENCKHPDCVAVREVAAALSRPGPLDNIPGS